MVFDQLIIRIGELFDFTILRSILFRFVNISLVILRWNVINTKLYNDVIKLQMQFSIEETKSSVIAYYQIASDF